MEDPVPLSVGTREAEDWRADEELGPPDSRSSSSSPSDSSRSDSGWMEERWDRCDPLPLAVMTGEDEECDDAGGSGEGARDRRVLLLRGLKESDATCPSETDPDA